MTLVHKVQNKDDLDNQLKKAGEKLVVVDFYATWCGPCERIAPKLEEFAKQMKDDVVFLKVDVDQNEEISEEYGINVMPAFILLKRGDKVGEFCGANADALKELIDSHK